MGDRTVTIKSSGGIYTSLNEALSTEDDSYGNLVSNAGITNFECYALDDTTAASTGTGYTVNASYYLNIYTDSTGRHAGSWDGDKYNLAVDDAMVLEINESYTRVDGLQLSANGGTQYSARFTSWGVQGCRFTNNIFKFSDTPASNFYVLLYGPGGASSASDEHLVYNCIFIGNAATGRGIQVGTTDTDQSIKIYNCTASGLGAGVMATAISTIKNCAIFNNSDDIANTGNGETIDYCATDDGDGTNAVNISPGGTESTDWAAAFTNYSTGDFSVKDTDSVLYDAGVSLAGTFTTDIIGTTRSTWDIGAFEYVSGGGGSAALPMAMNYYRRMRD